MKVKFHCPLCDRDFEREAPEGWDAQPVEVQEDAMAVLPPFCPECLDKFAAEAKADDETKRISRRAEMLKASGVPAPYWDGYDPDRGNNELKDWVKANATGSLLIQSRDSGKGKTWAVCHLATRIVRKYGKTVRYFEAIRMFREFSALLGQDMGAADRMVHELKRVDLLIIDDLGKEKLTDRGGELGFEVIDARLINGKPLWLTSNCGSGEIEEHFGERGLYLARRLREMCRVYDADKNEEVTNG